MAGDLGWVWSWLEEETFSSCWDEWINTNQAVTMLLQSCAFCGRQQVNVILPLKWRVSECKSCPGDYMNKLRFGHISVSVVHEWGEKDVSAHSLFSRLISVSHIWHLALIGFFCLQYFWSNIILHSLSVHRRVSKGKEDECVWAIPSANISLSP